METFGGSRRNKSSPWPRWSSASSQCWPDCSVEAINSRKISRPALELPGLRIRRRQPASPKMVHRGSSHSREAMSSPGCISASPPSGRRRATLPGRSGSCRRRHTTASYARARGREPGSSRFPATCPRIVHRRRPCERAHWLERAPRFSPGARTASAASRRDRSILPSGQSTRARNLMMTNGRSSVDALKVAGSGSALIDRERLLEMHVSRSGNRRRTSRSLRLSSVRRLRPPAIPVAAWRRS